MYVYIYVCICCGLWITTKWIRIINAESECGLSITTKANLKVVQFLDIEVNLKNNTYIDHI